MSEKNILIVDDDLDNIAFAEAVLRKAGFKTSYATDGAEGVTKAKAEMPDLILLDVQMPKMTGFEVYKALMEEESTRGIRVVMLTGIRDTLGRGYSQKDMKAFYGVAPASYLEKPASADEILRAVKDGLQCT